MGLVLGILVGAGLVGLASASGTPGGSPAEPAAATDVDVVHRSPLLVTPGEAPPLVYELVCAATEPDARCAAAGEVHVKALGARAFTSLPLHRGPDGALSAALDPVLYARGFAYYAVVREAGSGASRTLPPGGAAAPHHVYAMPRWTEVDLGTHAFGRTAEPARTVVTAAWGAGPGELGLDTGSERATVGASAFDVTPAGRVVVLDQVNRRLVTYSATGRVLRTVPVPIAGGIGDLALAPGGSAVIVEDGGPGSATPVVRIVSGSGRLVSSGVLAERTYGLVRWSPLGAIVQQTPSDTWLPATDRATRVLDPAEQSSRGLVGRLVAAARGVRAELVVDGELHQTRYALVASGRTLAAWVVRSDTPLGEVALAEPYAGGLLAVQRVWTEDRAEFVALRLGPAGVLRSWSMPAVEWAEASPLSRFRLGAGGLYQLRSAEDGVAVVRYALGAAS